MFLQNNTIPVYKQFTIDDVIPESFTLFELPFLNFKTVIYEGVEYTIPDIEFIQISALYGSSAGLRAVGIEPFITVSKPFSWKDINGTYNITKTPFVLERIRTVWAIQAALAGALSTYSFNFRFFIFKNNDIWTIGIDVIANDSSSTDPTLTIDVCYNQSILGGEDSVSNPEGANKEFVSEGLVYNKDRESYEQPITREIIKKTTNT